MKKMLRDLVASQASTNIVRLVIVLAGLSECVSELWLSIGTVDLANCLRRESLARPYPVTQPGWRGPGGWGSGYYPPRGMSW